MNYYTPFLLILGLGCLASAHRLYLNVLHRSHEGTLHTANKVLFCVCGAAASVSLFCVAWDVYKMFT